MVPEQIVSLDDSHGELTSIEWHGVVLPEEAIAALIGGVGPGFQGAPGPGPLKEEPPGISRSGHV